MNKLSNFAQQNSRHGKHKRGKCPLVNARSPKDKYILFKCQTLQYINLQLEIDLSELDHLITVAKRSANIDRLKTARQHVADEIAVQKRVAEAKAKREAAADQPKRFEFELTNYAWDQSDKFVKLFITLDGLDSSADDRVTVNFSQKSITLSITGVGGKDYKFEVHNLLDAIDVDGSYRKVKTNALVIYAKKSTESKLFENRIEFIQKWLFIVVCIVL